jgi:hypothetical protein
MTRQENEALAKRVSHFYERILGSENQLAFKLTIKHFKERGTTDYLKIPGKNLMRDLKTKLKAVGDGGVLVPYKL